MVPLCGLHDIFSMCHLHQQNIWAQYVSSFWREVALLKSCIGYRPVWHSLALHPQAIRQLIPASVCYLEMCFMPSSIDGLQHLSHGPIMAAFVQTFHYSVSATPHDMPSRIWLTAVWASVRHGHWSSWKIWPSLQECNLHDPQLTKPVAQPLCDDRHGGRAPEVISNSPNPYPLAAFQAALWIFRLAYPVAKTGRTRAFIPFLRSLTC